MVGHPFGLNTQGRFAILGLGMLVVPIKWKVCRLPDWTRKINLQIQVLLLVVRH